jgi:hypothetical protein
MILVIGVKLRRRGESGSRGAAASSGCDVGKDVKTAVDLADMQPYVVPVASSTSSNDCAMHYTEVALSSTATAGQEPTNSTHYTASSMYAIPFGSMQHRSGAASDNPSLCTDGYVIDDADGRQGESGSRGAAASSGCDVGKDVKTAVDLADVQPYVVLVASSTSSNDCAMHYTEVALSSTATAGQEATNSTHYTASSMYAIPFGSPEHAMQHRSGAASDSPSLCTDGYVIDDADGCGVDGSISTSPVYAQPYESGEVDCGGSIGSAQSIRGTPSACEASSSGTQYEYADVVA